MRKTFLIIFLLVLIVGLYAQYDEKAILLKQAQDMMQSRRFKQAEAIYTDLMSKYPSDYVVVLNLINLYIQTSNADKAYDLLNAKKDIFPSNVFSEQKISLLLQKNQVDEAFRLATDYLEQNRNQITLYRNIAALFEIRFQYDKAIQIYAKARQVSNDPLLHAMEIGNDYFQMRDFKNCIPEYFKLLQRTPSYYNYVSNQMQTLLKYDPKQITTIAHEVEKSPVPESREVYAYSLVAVSKYAEALQIYKQLSPEKLIQFADDQYYANRDSLALQAYQDALPNVDDPVKKADIRIREARIYILNGKTPAARQTLEQVINDNTIQQPRFKFRSRANREARELMAELLIQEKGSSKQVIEILNSAKQFAMNAAESDEIEFEIIRYQIMTGDYDDAKDRLSTVLKKENSGSAIFKSGYYYSYLIAAMQNDPSADSLLNECIIAKPESQDTNDALYLSFIIQGIKGSDRDMFLEAYRLRNLHQDLEAIAVLDSVYSHTNDEELRILKGDWAIQSKQYGTVRSAFSYDFKDQTLKEYAKLELAKLVEYNQNEQQQLSIDFLKSNPDSVFSPAFRMMLSVQSESPER